MLCAQPVFLIPIWKRVKIHCWQSWGCQTSHCTQSYLYSINGRSVLIKTSSAASFSCSLCGITTLTPVQRIWKFLTSRRAFTNSSQPSFINDGCISIFPCQQDLRNVASRFLKAGLANSFSVENLVSSTSSLLLFNHFPNYPTRLLHTAHIRQLPQGKKDPASPVTAPCKGLARGDEQTGSVRIFSSTVKSIWYSLWSNGGYWVCSFQINNLKKKC